MQLKHFQYTHTMNNILLWYGHRYGLETYENWSLNDQWTLKVKDLDPQKQ